MPIYKNKGDSKIAQNGDIKLMSHTYNEIVGENN